MIAENIQKVKKNMAEAARRSGRPSSSVQLVAVSKTKPVEALMEAYDAGIRFRRFWRNMTSCLRMQDFI